MKPFTFLKYALLAHLAAILWAAQLDTPENRLVAAKAYLKAVPPAEMIAATIDQVAAQLPPEKRSEFKKTLERVVNSKRLEALTLELVVKHFTVKEIQALTAFYSSPEGRSISRKFGAYMADVLPAVQAELEEALQEIYKDDN